LAVAIAIILAEAFLQITLEKERVFETWYTPGIHAPSKKFGFVFASGYKGYMRHKDKVWNVPLQLNEHGFRQPVLAGPGRPRRKVVMIGGASLMFCYGLPDHQTITSQIAKASEHNLEIHNTAWPGFDALRNWHVFLDTLDASEEFDAAIVAITPKHALKYCAALPNDFSQLPPHPPSEEFFAFMDGLAIRDRGRLAEALGPAYFRWFVAYKSLSLVDGFFPEQQGWRDLEPEEAVNLTNEKVNQTEFALQQFSRFLLYLDAHFRQRGTKMLVLFLPRVGRRLDFYDPLPTAIPQHIAWVDLHKELLPQLNPNEYIAWTHYSAEQAERIGKRLAEEIDRLLDADISMRGD
jgi:hypothetical protein